MGTFMGVMLALAMRHLSVIFMVWVLCECNSLYGLANWAVPLTHGGVCSLHVADVNTDFCALAWLSRKQSKLTQGDHCRG